MCACAVWELASAVQSTFVAAALTDGKVQVWDSLSAEKVSEFRTFYSFGGRRLALNPSGSACAVASWNKGKRGGIACYDAKSAAMLWHRTDIRNTQRICFASDSIYCGLEAGSLLRLHAATGETVEELIDVEEVRDSPYSAHVLMVCRSCVFVVEGPHSLRFPRTALPSASVRDQLPCSLTGAAFGPGMLWVAETGPVSTMRCFGFAGGERWGVEVPKPTMVRNLCYRKADQRLYGIEWDGFTGSWCYLIRYSDTGDGVRICPLPSPDAQFCLNGDIVVTSNGDVIEVEPGKTINSLRFPKP